MTTQDVVIIIGVSTTSIVSIINTIGLFWGKRDIKKRLNRANQRLMKAEDSRFHVARALSGQLDEAHKKLNVVEANTNGNITKLMDRVATLEAGMTKAAAEPKPEDKDKILIETVNSVKP